MRTADPWHDYLAFPVATGLLLVQITVTFLPWAWWRRGLSVACAAAIAVIAAYVLSIDTAPEEGANIAAGIAVLVLVASLALLVLLAIGEAVLAVCRGIARSRRRAEA